MTKGVCPYMDTHYCVPDQLQQMQRFNTAKYELIQSPIKAHQVDGSRVYISGVSSGGGAAIRFMMQYLDLFAGAVVIAAKDTVIPLSKKYDLAYKFTNNPDDLRLLTIFPGRKPWMILRLLTGYTV